VPVPPWCTTHVHQGQYLGLRHEALRANAFVELAQCAWVTLRPHAHQHIDIEQGQVVQRASQYLDGAEGDSAQGDVDRGRSGGAVSQLGTTAPGSL
jgi:hypothetical protein